MTETLIERRRRLMGEATLFYEDPVHLVRGAGVWLWDAAGRCYLDAYNNVPHVGHAHPAVVEAIARQSALLATHSRYLHEAPLDLLERLGALLGHGLNQGILVCSGSEANDAALRMAQVATGARGLIATDAAYHGNTGLVSALNRRPPPGGRPDFVRLVPAPDRAEAATPEGFAAGVGAAIDGLRAAGLGVAALILCPFFANEGFPDLAPGFLDPAAAAVRAAGGLVIADEVQPGYGRLGSHFWGHERIGLVPDIVTLGKPMGNGYPLAAVMTRPEILGPFRAATRYFNTFGGNPVAAAAGLAVLDALEAEGFAARAAQTGAALAARLGALGDPAVAGVRGAGLFLGVALRDATGLPDGARAGAVVEAMRARGVLLNRIGRSGELLKIRPPMPFGPAEAELFAETLAAALAATAPDG